MLRSAPSRPHVTERLDQPPGTVAAQMEEPDPIAVAFPGGTSVARPRAEPLDLLSSRLLSAPLSAWSARTRSSSAAPASPLSTASVMPVPASLEGAPGRYGGAAFDVPRNATASPGPEGLPPRERERACLARRSVVRVVDEAKRRGCRRPRPGSATDHECVAAAERGEVVEEAGQDGPTLDLEHGLGCSRREPAEAAALSRRQHHRRERLAGR